MLRWWRARAVGGRRSEGKFCWRWEGRREERKGGGVGGYKYAGWEPNGAGVGGQVKVKVRVEVRQGDCETESCSVPSCFGEVGTLKVG